ncbi:ATP-dependent DNA helicase RecG [Candidatus Saccharibacteria bacterium]|nr:ATP-dependent DNA helicase RecG [Candidatus Saccharibacteria bacterium]
MDEKVESLRGVGPKRAEILRKHGIKTVRDFFYNLPRDYENYERPMSIAEIRPGKVVIRGKIGKITTRRAQRRNLSVTEAEISDKTGRVKVVWFNQSYRAKQFEPEREYYFMGSYELARGRFCLMSPAVALATEVEKSGGLQPIYVAHGALKSHDFKRLVAGVRDKFNEIPDLLPSVPAGTRKKALFLAHFPESLEVAMRARDYLAYEELFELILAGRLNRLENEKLKAKAVKFRVEKVKEFLARLPFVLTDAQKKAVWEIFQDMERKVPMNRLLQGDVGSGKTMVAGLATFMAILSGQQVALLAPTAILAKQHFEGIKQILEPFRMTVALLTGATKDKKGVKKAILAGQINLVIGTHALLTDDTEFCNLGLVIIDEQHRFGVEQRQKLALKSPKGLAPHLLAMTATPIPRSLQLTVFGDLEVSILNQMPKGRKPIKTEILREIEISERLYPKILDTVRAKQQIYWVCKAIDDNSASETVSVKKRTEKLKAMFPRLRIKFLHGRMKQSEKDEIMEQFSKGLVDILVTTTVIEVGVDVPNASVMIIENAEGYGLAQIHQLRGRVGRGTAKSFCYLLTSGDLEPSRRLKELEKSTDGFYLAEVDLKMRGPGEIYGALQHGVLDLRIASLTDTRLIARARRDVYNFLKNPENMVKYNELMQNITKYQQITTLN